MWGMVCGGYASGAFCPFVGQWLEWYDPDLPTTGDLGGWTNDISKAKRFQDPEDVLEEFNRVRNGWAVRADGKMDRPLTAFHIEVRRIPDEPANTP